MMFLHPCLLDAREGLVAASCGVARLALPAENRGYPRQARHLVSSCRYALVVRRGEEATRRARLAVARNPRKHRCLASACCRNLVEGRETLVECHEALVGCHEALVGCPESLVECHEALVGCPESLVECHEAVRALASSPTSRDTRRVRRLAFVCREAPSQSALLSKTCERASRV
jgi:hypothetical protein